MRANESQTELAHHVNALVDECFNASYNAGWWDGLYDEPHAYEYGTPPNEPLQLKPLVVATKLMLTVSELSEAMEGDRKNKMDTHLPHRKMLEVELADACIRIFDLAGALGLDLGGAIIEKMAYNAQRADHKRENRAAEGGKKY